MLVFCLLFGEGKDDGLLLILIAVADELTIKLKQHFHASLVAAYRFVDRLAYGNVEFWQFSASAIFVDSDFLIDDFEKSGAIVFAALGPSFGIAGLALEKASVSGRLLEAHI